MKIIVSFLIFVFVFFLPSDAIADTYTEAFTCQYKYRSLRGSECNVTYVTYRTCGEASQSVSTSCSYSQVSQCYYYLFANAGSDSTALALTQDMAVGSLEISVDNTTLLDGSDYFAAVNDLVDLSLPNLGCGASDECKGLYDYLYEKLSDRFPLDIFMPKYNFNAPDTQCPEITLFGRRMDFCAPLMLAKVVKYIILIGFIISCVMSL